MIFETVPLLDARVGRWYGVILGRLGNRPATIMDQTEPIFATREECLAHLQQLLTEVLTEMGPP